MWKTTRKERMRHDKPVVIGYYAANDQDFRRLTTLWNSIDNFFLESRIFCREFIAESKNRKKCMVLSSFLRY